MRTVSRMIDSSCVELRTYDDDNKLIEVRKKQSTDVNIRGASAVKHGRGAPSERE